MKVTGSSRAWSWVIRFESWLLITSLLVLILLTAVQILLRNLLHTSIFWIDPFSRHLILWITMLGAARAAEQNSLLRIDLFQSWQGRLWKTWIKRVANLTAGIMALLLAWKGKYFLEIMSRDLSLNLQLITWILPAGFGLIGLHLFHSLLRRETDTRDEAGL